jgi:protein-tyrosine-phosphatase/DNA-binding transcriptional ArsR family regulator
MDADWMFGLDERAALHAALGDPGRLAVVELLTWGDRTPSELADLLGMRSNLLAHHVNVLVEHRIVRRTPSEGDRRRTYLSLVPGALDPVLPQSHSPAGAGRVLFVCTANSARSQLAAALWQRSSPLPATSAGTHPAARVDPGAERAARRHHLPALGVPRTLAAVHAEGDFVVTVCDRAHEETGPLASSHWSVPDPVGGDDERFEAAVAELERRVTDLAPRLAAATP